LGIQIEPVTRHQAVLACEGHRDFGKGSGRRSGLNFGDCFSYALAKEFSEPRLFKGDDFVHTDVEVATIG
jgi:ribonuclease VapC